MAEPIVRTLHQDEISSATTLVGRTMLSDLDPEVQAAWGAMFEPERTHGAFVDDQLAGVVRWFEGALSVPGGAVPAGLVSAVAVSPTHRRQGLLTRMIHAQLAQLAEQERAVATLIAAEWPIYGRFGYGPAVEMCTWTIDTVTARFLAPRTGTIELVDPATLRPHLEAVHDLNWARSPGAVTRQGPIWERYAGLVAWPGSSAPLGLRRGAIWRDAAGTALGAVAYRVEEKWVSMRPRGIAHVELLVAGSAEAERELWRHLCDTDWIGTVTAESRSVGDPLPLLLWDGRAAVESERSDCIWARILDVPATFGAYRADVPRQAVVEVVDPQGFAAGRWQIEIGPEGSQAATTAAAADVRLSISSLSAAHLGGTSVARLHAAGHVDEERPGGVARVEALLATPTPPWSPTHY